jgi:superfamily I DNA/RNA helicase
MERLLAASHERKASVFATMKNPAVTAAFQARTRESIEAFVAFIERTQGTLDQSSLRSPLSARERENRSQFNARRAADDGSTNVETSGGGQPLSPLPKGEGALQAWANHFLTEIGYLDELRGSEKDREAGESRVRNLRDLVATLDTCAPAAAPLDRLQTFLEEISLDTDREEEDEAKGDAVTLITMHSCKGLEFPHVYVVGMEDGLLPHSRSKTEGTLDEERRLFYVAVTRAMLSLAISHCGGRKKYGQLMPCHPSPFLKELPADLVEHEDEKSKKPVAQESGRNFFAAMRQAAD